MIIVTGCCVWPAPQMNEVKRMNNWPLRNETLWGGGGGFNPSVFRNPSDCKSPDSSIRASVSMAGPTSLAESKMVTGKTPSTLDSLVYLRLRRWPRERAEGRERRTCLTFSSPPPRLYLPPPPPPTPSPPPHPTSHLNMCVKYSLCTNKLAKTVKRSSFSAAGLKTCA